jgi:glutaredoxin-like YruB-family protein
MATVTIYTSPTCSACNAAKQFLKSKNVAFTECDITKDEAKAQEIAKKAGQSVVPIIDIDGTLIVGFDQGKVSKALGLS